MNKPESRIPQEHTDEIFALAAELQTKQEQTYSVAELQKIGAEAHISPESGHRISRSNLGISMGAFLTLALRAYSAPIRPPIPRPFGH